MRETGTVPPAFSLIPLIAVGTSPRGYHTGLKLAAFGSDPNVASFPKREIHGERVK